MTAKTAVAGRARRAGTPSEADQAIGSWEAAAVMGVHWTQPAIMAEKGLLTARVLKSPTASGDRVFAVYSLAEANKDFDDYVEARKQKSRGRPRAHVDLRPDGLKRLAAIKHKISFGDAIGCHEAAEILGVHWTFPPRMARAGKIIGRMIHNGRADKSNDRLWIFSRASCEAEIAATKAAAKARPKIGRPRSGLS